MSQQHNQCNPISGIWGGSDLCGLQPYPWWGREADLESIDNTDQLNQTSIGSCV